MGAYHIEKYIWLQHAEYLSRVPQIPSSVQSFPAFCYAAYNGGVGAANSLVDDVETVIAADPATWAGKTYEDVLGSWQLTSREISQTPKGGTSRSLSARVNGLQAAALVYSYAGVFPRVI